MDFSVLGERVEFSAQPFNYANAYGKDISVT